MKVDFTDIKRKVVREAAVLLYSGAEKEYKQAKLRAAEILGVKFLPANLEVALELDKIAEENEGSARKERLIKMREEALKMMRVLGAYNPLLIGSVWRGTIRQGSDIDIVVYHDLPSEVVDFLKANGFKIVESGWVTVTKRGKTESSFHVYVETLGKQRVEIVVRGSDEAGRRRKCEVFGDEIKGLSIQELEELLEENPVKRFIPV